jgi:hypothetical protein
MGTTLALGLAAAVYPQLLAVVVIILTRPNPQPLLWSCCLGGLLVSSGAGVVIFAVFQSHESVAGTTSHRLGPGAYLAVGVIAVVIAIAMATRRGRGRPEQEQPASRRSWLSRRPHSATMARTRVRAERSLSEGSLVVAFVVGGVLGVPGPFDLVAVGRLSRNGYGILVAGGALVVFALIKFVLIELPIVGYAIDPEGTAARVGRFSRWMHANEVLGIAAFVALFGIILILRGISRLG